MDALLTWPSFNHVPSFLKFTEMSPLLNHTELRRDKKCRLLGDCVAIPGLSLAVMWLQAPSTTSLSVPLFVMITPTILTHVTKTSKSDPDPGLMAVTIWGNVSQGRRGQLQFLSPAREELASFTHHHEWLPDGLWKSPLCAFKPLVGKQELKLQAGSNLLEVADIQTDLYQSNLYAS